MKKRDKLIAGLIVGGAIGSVLGYFASKDKNKNSEINIEDGKEFDSMIKPKRKGIILRFLDWLDR